jgi:hypothetical protein
MQRKAGDLDVHIVKIHTSRVNLFDRKPHVCTTEQVGEAEQQRAPEMIGFLKYIREFMCSQPLVAVVGVLQLERKLTP